MIAPPPPLAFAPDVLAAIEDGADIVFSLSGGKDSSAAGLAVTEFLDSVGHPAEKRRSIHADLGMIEWQSTPSLVTEIASILRTPLTTVARKAGGLIHRWEQRWQSSLDRFERLETYQLVSPWSSAKLRYCTSETKVAPIGSRLRRDYAGRTVISVVGIRREESSARAATPVWRRDSRFAPVGNRAGTVMLTWHPILDWTAEDVFAFHTSRNLPLHEAYALNSTRLSCSYCVLASLNNLSVASLAPGNHPSFRRITALETRSAFSFQPSRWLADVSPHLLSDAELAASQRARRTALRRRTLEATLPADLRFKRGWPPRVPTKTEAVAIASVRDAILRANGRPNHWPHPSDVRDRFAELHIAKAA